MSIPLPNYYLEWLKGLDKEAYLKNDDRYWSIYSVEDLNEEVDVDKLKTRFWCQLRSYAEVQSQYTKKDSTVTENGEEFKLTRLSECITIGEENGDPLFCDPSDNYSVWCYYLDGADVQKLSPSLQQFITESEVTSE